MRIVLALAVAFGLSGCADMDFFGEPVGSATPASDTAATAAQSPAMSEAPQATAEAPRSAAPNAHCINLAKLRARDAAYEGEDEDTQEAVYNKTLSDCTAWDAKHGS